MILAIAPDPLDVVLFETPILAGSPPPHNPLRGFIQEAVSLLGQPTSEQIAVLLHLPDPVVELILGNIQLLGGLTVDSAGRWTIPKGAPRFSSEDVGPPIWRRTRRLLCYWPERQVMLPVLPRLRLRDLVELGVHRLQGEMLDWYQQCLTWTPAETLRRGLPDSVRLLPLSDSAAPAESIIKPVSPDSPVPLDQVLVTRCHMDIIALSWATFRSGLWELSTRLWSRPTPLGDSEGEPFVPGEPVVGLSLLEHLLGGQPAIDALGQLFNPGEELWQSVLGKQDMEDRLTRELDGEWPAMLTIDEDETDDQRRWHVVSTSISGEARLIATSRPADSSR